MNVWREMAGRRTGRRERSFPVRLGRRAFSLIELLVVVGIVGVLAGLAVHSLPALRTGNQINAANRQLLDALAEARSRAVSSRSTVYLVFVPPYFYTNTWGTAITTLPAQQYNQFSNLWNNLIPGQYTTYALYAERQVGDQPGNSLGRYLTEWRSLPKGTYLAVTNFSTILATNALPFPDETFPQTNYDMRTVGFTSQGQLLLGKDLDLYVSQGSLLFSRNPDGSYIQNNGDPREVPPNNYLNNAIHVNWLTGRGRIVQPQIQ